MNLTVPRHELKDALTGLGKIVGTSNTLPILNGIRFDADTSGITAQATDLDSVARYRFQDATHSGTGGFIVELNLLKELAKGTGKDLVDFATQDQDRLTVITQAGGQPLRRSLATMDLEEWPDMNVETPTTPVPGLLETYRRLLPFASRDETRYVLNGVCLDVTHKGENAHMMVATDGRRLGRQNTMNLPVGETCVLRISRFLSWTKLPADAEVGLTKVDDVSWIGIKAGAWSFVTRAIDGTYPNWRQVVPTEPGHNRMQLTEQDVKVLQTAIPSLPGDGEIMLVGRDGRVSVWAMGRDDPEWTTLELPQATFEGAVSYVSLDRTFVQDALKGGFMRSIHITDELCPVYSEDGQGGIHVIMPCRVQPPEEIERAIEAARQPPDASDPDPESPPEKKPTEHKPPQDKPTEHKPPQDKPAEHKPQPPDTSGPTTKGKPKTMAKPNHQKTQEIPATALDRALTAYEVARTKVREANSALSDVASELKAAVRDQKAQAREMDQARTALSKLQAISL